MPTGTIIKPGDEFARLTVLAPAGLDRDGKTLWLCACACFNLTWARTAQLNSGLKKSCGCLRRDAIARRNLKHGMSKRQQHAPEYDALAHMKARCNNPDNPAYRRYGERGIRVCDGLDDFMAFYRLVGRKPSPQHSIERINNDGNYSCGACPECKENDWPMNVKWATKREQSQNRSITVFLTHENETHCVAEWSRITGYAEQTIRGRMKAEWPVELILTTPPSKQNRLYQIRIERQT